MITSYDYAGAVLVVGTLTIIVNRLDFVLRRILRET
jgi:hypothetical protein